MVSEKGKGGREDPTFSPDSEIPCTDLVSELAFLSAAHLLVFFGTWAPVFGFEDLERVKVLRGL
jgi:hypothetical protein